MALYQYTAISPSGKSVQGLIGADSIELAKERLRLDKVTVTGLKEYIAPLREVRLSSAMLLTFTQDLSLLLHAGFPLYESLVSLEEKYRQHKTHSLFLDLGEKVKHGYSLSDALRSYQKTFNTIYISLIAAGERSGDLETVLGQLARLIERQQRLRRQIKQAMIYPAFLFTMCIGVVSALFLFLIPTLKELFEDRPLHPLTSFILKTSDFLHAHPLPIFATIAAIPLSLFFFFRSRSGRAFREKLILFLPLLKKLFAQSVLYRFSSSLSLLLKAGVPMLEALALARASMQSPIFEEVIEEVEKRVIEGKSLSAELRRSSLIPLLFTRMLAVAEESGTLPEMLGNIAHIYESDLDKNLLLFITILQPALLLLLGIIVGSVLLSVLLPLTDVSSLIN